LPDDPILVLRAIPEKHTDLSVLQCVLGIANVFTIGDAGGEGDQFFDSVAEGIYQLSIPGGQLNVKSLRTSCLAYAEVNKGSVYYSHSDRTWH